MEINITLLATFIYSVGIKLTLLFLFQQEAVTGYCFQLSIMYTVIKQVPKSQSKITQKCDSGHGHQTFYVKTQIDRTYLSILANTIGFTNSHCRAKIVRNSKIGDCGCIWIELFIQFRVKWSWLEATVCHILHWNVYPLKHSISPSATSKDLEFLIIHIIQSSSPIWRESCLNCNYHLP